MATAKEGRTPKNPDWLTRYEIVARVTSAIHCANYVREGEHYTFDLNGILKPEKSTANPCLGILARLQPAFLLSADRASLGAHPISPGWNTFDCFDTGIDHGGTGKVCVRLELRDVETGELVSEATLD